MLKEISFVVYLHDDILNIKERFELREKPYLVGMGPGVSFESLMLSREELYRKHADVIIDVSKDPEETSGRVIRAYCMS